MKYVLGCLLAVSLFLPASARAQAQAVLDHLRGT